MGKEKSKHNFLVTFGNGRYNHIEGTLPEVIKYLQFTESYKLYEFKMLCELKQFGAPNNFVSYVDIEKYEKERGL